MDLDSHDHTPHGSVLSSCRNGDSLLVTLLVRAGYTAMVEVCFRDGPSKQCQGIQ